MSERNVLTDLEDIVKLRQTSMPPDSYTAKLFSDGQPKISRKINEESFEVIQALEGESPERVISEIADLMYHLTVGMVMREGVSWNGVFEELERRKEQ